MVDSKQNLQANPNDKMVYYLEQHSTILSQISQQIASIAPQVSVPSTPPPPFPAFSPLASDIRINAFWFMALAFSLSAALLAILVQQWVRDYMHVFDRYSDPQKSARMRQYLNEGSERWYMPIAAEAVPGLLHISLFLFFAGLADSTLNINTTIGICTTVPIGICGLLYLLITLAPVIYPQSPYQTSYSGVLWYAIQTLRGRRYKDRNGESKSVSTNMAQGQMQLSTEGTMDREGRDKRAILWLMDNLTENNEIESFVTSMPGSLEAWAELSKEDVKPPVSESPLHSRVINWITRQFRTIWDAVCKIPSILCSGLCCILTLYALVSIYVFCYESFRKIRFFIRHLFTSSSPPTNAMTPQLASRRPFVATSDQERISFRDFCWRVGHFFNTCQNGAVFANDELRQKRAIACVEVMASLVSHADVEVGSFGDTLQTLGDIGNCEGRHNLLDGRDETFVMRRRCLSILAIRSSQNWWRGITGDVPQVLLFWEIEQALEDRWAQGIEHESGLSSWISFAVDKTQTLYGIDFNVAEKIEQISQGTTLRLLGVDLDYPDSEPLTLELFRDPAKLRFISCRQPLSKFFDYLKRLDSYRDNSPNTEDMLKQAIDNVVRPKHLLQQMSWSRDDFKSGGLGFVVELFLLFLREILSTSSSLESYSAKYSALYIGTFRAITSDGRGSTGSPGTIGILLDAVASGQGFLRTFNFPNYIMDEIWDLLGDILKRQKPFLGMESTIVSNAVQQLRVLQLEVGGEYGARAEALISRLRPKPYGSE